MSPLHGPHARFLARALATLPALALMVLDASGAQSEPEPPSAADVERHLGDATQSNPMFGVDARDVSLVNGDPAQLEVPAGVVDTAWLQTRAREQLATASQLEVFHGFRFTDRLPQSGIGFTHKIVDDAGKFLKAVHYDHGNGLAVADVDLDGLPDLYFTTQLGGNQLWRNLGEGRFEDWTEWSGAAVADRIGVSASFADVDNDGDADLFVTTVRGGNLLFENDGAGRFKDISAASGLDYVGHSSGAVFFDYDRDGLLDLFLTNVGSYTTDELGAGGYYVGQPWAFFNHLTPATFEQSLLYRNMGENRFVDVSEAVGLVDKGWSGDASPADLNEDGWPDLYVLNMQGHDEYYENAGGKRFVRKGREVFPATPWGAMGIGIFDYNNDGRMDILVTDMHTDMWNTDSFAAYLPEVEKVKQQARYGKAPQFLATDGNHVLGNALYRNEGGGRFLEVSDALNVENFWPWGLSVGDVNADGFEDVFIASSMNFTFRYGVNSMLLNNRGRRFIDSEFILGVEPRREGRTAKPWFELACTDGDREHPLCSGREGKVTVWGALGTRSSAIVDLDEDGDLDIVTNEFNAEPMVLMSDLSDRGAPLRYLKVALIGGRSNRDGLGARVVVTTHSQTLTKYQDGKSGYLSQSRLPLYFGLGSAASVRSIEVHWPSGTKQRVDGPIETNQLLELREPGTATPPHTDREPGNGSAGRRS